MACEQCSYLAMPVCCLLVLHRARRYLPAELQHEGAGGFFFFFFGAFPLPNTSGMVALEVMWHETGHKALPWNRLQMHAPLISKSSWRLRLRNGCPYAFAPAMENASNHYTDMLTVASTSFCSLAHTSLTAGWKPRTSACRGRA